MYLFCPCHHRDNLECTCVLILFKSFVLCPSHCFVVMIYIEHTVVIVRQASDDSTIVISYSSCLDTVINERGYRLQIDGVAMRILLELRLKLNHLLLNFLR